MNTEIERIRRKYDRKRIKENEKLNKILVDFQNEKRQFDFYRKFDLISLIDMEECIDKLKYAEQNKKIIEIGIPVYVGIGAIINNLLSSAEGEFASLLAYIVTGVFLAMTVAFSFRIENERLKKISEYSTRLYVIRDIINEQQNIRGN